MKDRNTNFYKIIVAVIFISIILFYLKYVSQPLFGWYGSREVQTAITAYWIDFRHISKSLFSYETPILGYPWSIPFEFPLFQIGAAGLHFIAGLPLDQSGRYLSAFFYFCCFIPLYNIIKEIELDKECFYIAAVLLLLSPLYLYWSRTFLIESTALFTGFLFLWASICFSKTGKFRWIFWTLFFGFLCSLVKITTFPSFVLASLVGGVAISTKYFSKITIKKCILEIVPLLLVLALCFVSVKLWTEHADVLKEKNPIAIVLTSKNLQGWNFGNFSQRFSTELWRTTIVDRIIPHAIGSIFCLLPILLGILFGNNRQKGLIVLMMLLFLAPILIFTNLHIVHDYYQYANSFWLIFSLAFSLYVIASKKSRLLAVTILIMVGYSEFSQYENFYKKFVVDINASREDSKNMDRLAIASSIKNSTPSNSIIVIFGEEWFPEISYYSERKSIMIPCWVTTEQAKNILENGEIYGGLTISAIIINNNDKRLNKEIARNFLIHHQYLDRKNTLENFDIYMSSDIAAK
ncbi:MAG: glycosyltransferase family 39 protein [Chthoniobacterales bacterium]|nr:glycosyltransferase family 39 protein [Chthoniobacterales bacterium]